MNTQEIRHIYRLIISLLCSALFGLVWMTAWPMPPELWGILPFSFLIFILAYGVMGFVGGAE